MVPSTPTPTQDRTSSPAPPVSPSAASSRRPSLFHKRTTSASSARGLFHRRSSSAASQDPDPSKRRPSTGSSRRSSWFGWHAHEDVIPEDPSLKSAREELKRAEHAEIMADRAAVRAAGVTAQARQNVMNLEHEARERARHGKSPERTRSTDDSH